MEVALVILFMVAVLAAQFAYIYWLNKSIRPRRIQTHLSIDQLDSVFTNQVAGKGWKVVDDGNPMIAQSPLMTGIRQQIQMMVVDQGPTRSVVVEPIRIVRKRFGAPSKAHTLRFRMNSFAKKVSSMDQNAQVQVG